MYLPVIETNVSPSPNDKSGVYLDVTSNKVWIKQEMMAAYYVGIGSELGLIRELPKPDNQSTGITEQTLLKTLAIALRPELGINMFNNEVEIK